MQNQLTRFSLLALILFTAIATTGCNFTPGALFGDVNADDNRSCSTREMKSQGMGAGNCVSPPNPINLIKAAYSGYGGGSSVALELNRDSAEAADWEITEMKAVESYGSETPYSAVCEEDRDKAQPTSQTFTCTIRSSYRVMHFVSMTVENKKCGARTQYTLAPEYCGYGSYYSVSYGSKSFPSF